MNVQQLAQVGIDSFNDRSFQEKAKDIMDDNVVIIDRPTGQEIHGVDGYIQYSERFVTAIPDLTGTVIEHQVKRNKVISRVRRQGKFTGKLQTPHGSFQGNGNPIDIEYQIEQEFNDAGKIKRFVVHFDLSDFMHQLSRRYTYPLQSS
jgi:predicted ester cyclase